MDGEARYFTLTLDSLRAIGGWTADCAERALPVFEAARPRIIGPVRRSKASGSSPAAASARPDCAPSPCGACRRA